jgi:predicted transcriptional regulator of viral defense system
MKGEDRQHLNAREYVAGLAARGRYHFVSADAQSALGVSPAAAKLALNRLNKQKVVASPARGFYVIVPPEYQALRCLPADQFIPDLMKRVDMSYYAGLLSAAQYHGAAHHRPQEFQVCLPAHRRPIQCGAVRVVFIVRKQIPEVPVQPFNTPRGAILVSTPEATALDLVGYAHHVGGLDNAATVLSELAEKIDPDELVAAAHASPVSWAQRLGYILELIGNSERIRPLKAYVHQHANHTVALLASGARKRSHDNRDWKLHVNVEIDAESL